MEKGQPKLSPRNRGASLNLLKVGVLAGIFILAALVSPQATVAVSSLYGSNMVLQRDRQVPVWGTAGAGKTITAVYNGQTETIISGNQASAGAHGHLPRPAADHCDQLVGLQSQHGGRFLGGGVLFQQKDLSGSHSER